MAAPVLTVVVPVFRVERFLRQCLDSILAGAPPGIEVVAVDDASPDHCGQILKEYGANDTRLRVLNLSRNVGLGAARNIGLEQARGDYVWFVYSDDWLTPGAVEAVVNEVRESRPDVLLVDHVRVYPRGRPRRDATSRLLRTWRAGEIAPLARRPEMLCLQHTAWNKVVRREFLNDIELRFFPGYYEDYPFSHPVLMAAKRIAVLDRVCYQYRQRTDDGDAITHTPGRRHFEAFDQYERLFALLDEWGQEYDRWRPRLFQLMINHLIVIVGNEQRVPLEMRREYFARMSEFYRRYRPAGGYPMPASIDRIKHHLVRLNAFRLYALLRRGYRVLWRRPDGRRPPAPQSARPGVLSGQSRQLADAPRPVVEDPAVVAPGSAVVAADPAVNAAGKVPVVARRA